MANRQGQQQHEDGYSAPAVRRILVVDDEESIRHLLFEALTRRNYAVETSASVLSALERLRHGTYDLILLDVRMPEIDGRELFATLSREDPEAAARVVFMTGDIANTEVQRFLAGSRRPLLTKPFGITDLYDMVATQLDAGASQRGKGLQISAE